MTNYHKLFLDSNYKAAPFQAAKPFFALFNASNYWIQAALVIIVFIILNFMPFMREASRRAGGDQCPSLFGMFKDAFVRKEAVHQICNQTPDGYNQGDGGESETEDCEEITTRRYKTVREARYPPCPMPCIPTTNRDTCRKVRCEDTCGGLPPPSLRCCEPRGEPPCGDPCGDSCDESSACDMIPVRAHCRATEYSGCVPVRAHCRRAPSTCRPAC